MECALQGEKREAVAICHCCCAGLCLEHVAAVPKRLEQPVPVCHTETAAMARSMLCETYKAAMEQAHLQQVAGPGISG